MKAPGYGFAFRVCRAAVNASQEELAGFLGLSPSHVSLIEAGKRSPSLDVLMRAAQAFDMEGYLFVALAEGAVDDVDVAVKLLRWFVSADRLQRA